MLYDIFWTLLKCVFVFRVMREYLRSLWESIMIAINTYDADALCQWVITKLSIDGLFQTTHFVHDGLLSEGPVRVRMLGNYLHCADGPAYMSDNLVMYFRLGKLHNDRGPAIMWNNEYGHVYKNGHYLGEAGEFSLTCNSQVIKSFDFRKRYTPLDLLEHLSTHK